MTSVQITVLVVYGVIVAIWPIRLFVLDLILRRQPIATPQSPRYNQPDFPLVSAIIPAKDEEANLEACARSIGALDYPNLEILIVNDRSTDQTPLIARRLAAADPRILAIDIDDLPAGWTGKTHALDRATRMTQGQWLLYVDADTLHTPESLSIMMEVARSSGAALVSVLPELRCETFWEQVVQPVAGITLMQSFPLHTLNDPRSPLAFANGQYILIERSAYDAVGGHRSVREHFVEDIALARLVKGLGLPIHVALVRGLVTCRMYASLRQLERGWSRILYAALDRKLWRLSLKLLDPIVFCQLGHVALLASVAWLAVGGGGVFAVAMLSMSVIHHLLMYAVFHRVYAVSVPRSRFVAWFPVANIVVDAILVRAIRLCWTGKVSWRGTEYPPGHSSSRASARGPDGGLEPRPDSELGIAEPGGVMPATRES